MFADDFETGVHKSRKAAFDKLEKRTRVPTTTDLDLWYNAWDAFSVEAFAQIPTPTCFPLYKDDSPAKRKEYTVTYKLESVRRILPNLKTKRHLLTGRAKEVVDEAINTLEGWKFELPRNLVLAPPFKKSKIHLNYPEEPETLQLPLPPTKRKKTGSSRNRAFAAPTHNSPERALGKLPSNLPSTTQKLEAHHHGYGETDDEDIPSEFFV